MGSGDIDNLLPQACNINRVGGEYYELEELWANAVKGGAKVTVDVVPNYIGNSLRPESFDIKYWINGSEFSVSILNQ